MGLGLELGEDWHSKGGFRVRVGRGLAIIRVGLGLELGEDWHSKGACHVVSCFRALASAQTKAAQGARELMEAWLGAKGYGRVQDSGCQAESVAANVAIRVIGLGPGLNSGAGSFRVRVKIRLRLQESGICL